MMNRQLACEVKPHIGLFLLTVAGGIAGGILAVLQANEITLILEKTIFDKQGLTKVQSLFLMLALIIFCRAVGAGLTSLVAHKLAQKIKLTVRLRLIDHLLAISPVQMVELEAGAVLALVTEGVEQVEQYFTRYLPQLGMAVIVPLVILCFVFPIDLVSAGLLLGTACIIPFFMALIGHAAERMNQTQWERLSHLSAHFFDIVQGLTTLKLFGRSKEQTAVIDRMASEFRVLTMRVLRVAFLSAFVLELFSTIGTALVAVTIGLKLLYGTMTFYQAFFILLLAPEFYLPLRLLGSYFHAGMAGTAVIGKIQQVLDIVPPVRQGSTGISAGQQIGITFSNVEFAYANTAVKTLHGVTFSIAPGEKVALVGESGSGKSTVAKLALGFIKASGGSIMVNGKPLEEINYGEWLTRLAYVPQQPHLFRGTIAENICLGQAPQGEMVAAAKAAGAHDFICALPKGYDTVVGEGGRMLSGGERQRLSLARAFLRSAPLLILDEPASALDPASEEFLAHTLKKLMEGRTVLMIAHRLSTVAQADKVLFFSKGHIVESGSPKELLQKHGFYAKLIKTYRGAL
ncbi:MAG: thiol reductant ABC exporter subunit CydD [Pelosinus sp.]|nr:thiol reductant ABC exporter subunit CydD [Pelosinus sp.]